MAHAYKLAYAHKGLLAYAYVIRGIYVKGEVGIVNSNL